MYKYATRVTYMSPDCVCLASATQGPPDPLPLTTMINDIRCLKASFHTLYNLTKYIISGIKL